MLKKYTIDAELAEYAYKLGEKLQSLCEWFFCGCCAPACQALPQWNKLTNNTLRKQRWCTFLFPKIWMP